MSEATNCRARLWRGFHETSCSRRATHDGYCAQHHPDAEAARAAAHEAASAAMKSDRIKAAARARNRIKAEALREAADAVPHGGWDHVDVQDWLRERATALEAGL